MHIWYSCGATFSPFALHHPALCSLSKSRGFASAAKGLTIMILSHIVNAYRQWRRYNRSLVELSRLGDRELADIGISRGDIPRVAWESSER
jgi:uncharacterized protein YjiS (DUF1127 family)